MDNDDDLSGIRNKLPLLIAGELCGDVANKKTEPAGGKASQEISSYPEGSDDENPASAEPALTDKLQPVVAKTGEEVKERKFFWNKVLIRGGSKNILQYSDFKWLRSDINERAIFWFWLVLKKGMNLHPEISSLTNRYIRTSSFIKDSDIYSCLFLPEFTTSTAERTSVIIDFFNRLSDYVAPEYLKEFLNGIRHFWLTSVSPVKKIRWINKNNEEDIEWAWKYLRKKKIENSILDWFRPTNLHEKYLAIMGTVDCWMINDNEHAHAMKDKLIKEMHLAFRQHKRRQDNRKSPRKTRVSRDIHKQLKELAKLHNCSGNNLIMKVIHEEYLRYKNNPQEYQLSISGREK
ncbi:hypothetical protein DWD10_21235 [Salmonella enterica]|uniref:Uncharacterized protein n=1 Tax=Salmonella enterica TaxID=28901 RepID=A0A5T8B9H8_SALER|nr:hypothetical protein [Salmonella enterica]EBN4400467.1 hypothetical protein [Salmonella enterica]EJZ7017940.1 hypothetical protein [Salmonella enterica]